MTTAPTVPTLADDAQRGSHSVQRIVPRRRYYLQAKYCRRQASYLWGQKRIIKPVLLPVQFGDGKQIIALRPIATRTHHYVVAINSSPDLHEPGYELHDDLDAIYDEIREHFGDCTGDDSPQRDPFKAWPAICLDVGSEWWQLKAGNDVVSHEHGEDDAPKQPKA